MKEGLDHPHESLTRALSVTRTFSQWPQHLARRGVTRTDQVTYGDRVGILLSATLALDVTRAECLWAGSVFDMSSFGQQKLIDVMCHLQGQLQMQPHVS